MNINLFKKAKENWQILATLLIFWSVFDLFNYYNPFGIDIQHYVNVSEILLLTFPTILNGIISILLIMLFFAIGLRNNRIETEPEKIKLIEIMNKHSEKLFHFKETFNYIKEDIRNFNFKKILSLLVSILSIIMELFLIAFILFVIYAFYKLYTTESFPNHIISNSSRFALIAFTSYFFLSPLFFLISEYFENYAHQIFSKLSIIENPIMYFVIGFIFNSIISNRIQYLNTVNGFSEKKVCFIYNDIKIETNSNLVYIGSTHDYLFIRDNNDSLSMVFKKDEIKNLIIKKN